MEASFPAEPLRRRIRAWLDGTNRPLADLAASSKVDHRTLIRVLGGQPRVYLATADQLAIALGSHPGEIWPDEWWWPTEKAYEYLAATSASDALAAKPEADQRSALDSASEEERMLNQWWTRKASRRRR